MNKYVKSASFLLLAGFVVSAAGCGGNDKTPAQSAAGATQQQTSTPPAKAAPEATPPAGTASPKSQPDAAAKPQPDSAAQKPQSDPAASKPSAPGDAGKSVQVVANPTDRAVLVNKMYKLPDNYEPQDLVDPNVPFIFKEKLEKRKMRKEAAEALEKLFKAAADDKLPLAGVSAYRSYATQKSVYSNYVKADGEEAANKYSAKPGQSEHETGLAIDVSGSSGKCAATDCFGDTKEAKWLADHAADYGFIIRYLKGKESITGYQYEPWHLRYVGTEMAKEIAKRGITLEEYLGKATPVSKP
ncbi:M15 family metallopeptidase [Paenibacillus thalictri]|uniref:D-alanyl-D-alanine carboxypeptidase family protein n=1 Tax=Paenibacillus thalictri TaxID=2527873 RepID=A0A4Q9DK72_9BACL|nr:M15 family metallopeptidase [Paenibacillus thalictri]TBL75134.1 D-alanyl-D-alanine carboxypeptidase family protein [Paenibacillus thalictri]